MPEKEIRTVALEDLMAGVVLGFCENLAELGCPKEEKNSDMWFRYMSPKERSKIMGKLLDIMERDEKRFASVNLSDDTKNWNKACLDYADDKYFCPKCSKKKMKKDELIGCKDLTKKQWEDGFTVDKDKKFSQKNCPKI